MLTCWSIQDGTTPIIEPFTSSVMLPDASRNADPPEKNTNSTYEIIEMSSDSRVPFGMALAGS